jgi:hypothetical protein
VQRAIAEDARPENVCVAPHRPASPMHASQLAMYANLLRTLWARLRAPFWSGGIGCCRHGSGFFSRPGQASYGRIASDHQVPTDRPMRAPRHVPHNSQLVTLPAALATLQQGPLGPRSGHHPPLAWPCPEAEWIVREREREACTPSHTPHAHGPSDPHHVTATPHAPQPPFPALPIHPMVPCTRTDHRGPKFPNIDLIGPKMEWRGEPSPPSHGAKFGGDWLRIAPARIFLGQGDPPLT